MNRTRPLSRSIVLASFSTKPYFREDSGDSWRLQTHPQGSHWSKTDNDRSNDVLQTNGTLHTTAPVLDIR